MLTKDAITINDTDCNRMMKLRIDYGKTDAFNDDDKDGHRIN